MTVVLNVAEKPSVARELTKILSGGRNIPPRRVRHDSCKFFDFEYNLRCIK